MRDRTPWRIPVNDCSLFDATWLSTSNYLRRYDHGIFPSKNSCQMGANQKSETVVAAQKKC